MDKLAYKKSIIAACHQAVQSATMVTQQTMGQHISDATESNEEGWGDKYESKDEEMIEDSRQLEPHLDFLYRELAILDGLNPESVHEQITQGSVVITDSMRFLIATSSRQFTVDGKEFVGISTAAPIYETMQGKKAGDSFSFNNKKYQIKEVF